MLDDGADGVPLPHQRNAGTYYDVLCIEDFTWRGRASCSLPAQVTLDGLPWEVDGRWEHHRSRPGPSLLAHPHRKGAYIVRNRAPEDRRRTGAVVRPRLFCLLPKGLGEFKWCPVSWKQ